MQTFGLVKAFVESLTFTSDNKDLDSQKMDMSYEVGYPEESNSQFAVKFNLEVNITDTTMLHVKYVIVFQAESELTEEFKESHLTTVNAPAIGYPYLRAFVANLVLNAGFGEAHLPAVNFNKFKKTEH